jgi:NitT/TauT family transport system permease protein
MASAVDNDAVEEAVLLDGDRRRRHRLFILSGRLVLLLVVVGLWEALARTGLIPAAFIGQPSKFLPLLVEGLLDGKIAVAAVDTLSATLMAFVLGGVLALATALMLAVYPTVKELIDPFIDAMNALPRVALVPLFIVWFGLGTLSKVVSGVSLMYFILLYNTLAGAQSVDPDHLQLARSLGLPRRQVFLRVVIPTAIPSIFVGLRLGLVYTLLGVVTAELIAGGKGLGSLISYYSNTFDADGVFAVLLVLIVLADALSMVMTRIERWLTRWNR